MRKGIQLVVITLGLLLTSIEIIFQPFNLGLSFSISLSMLFIIWLVYLLNKKST